MSPVITTNTAAPPLPAELEALMRSLKIPHARTLAPELIATARAQRWEPAEVIKALFAEEAAGRVRSMLASRRKAARPQGRKRAWTGKTFDAWDPDASSIPAPPSRRCGRWNGPTAGKTWSSAGPPEPARRSASKRSASKRWKPG